MRSNERHSSLHNRRRFENAKWVLKDNESGTISEKDYSEMATLVINGYVSHHNQERIEGEDIRVKELNIAGGLVAARNWNDPISYSTILPNYTVIECYDYKFQCKECKKLFDEVRKREEKKESKDYCTSCRSWVTVH